MLLSFVSFNIMFASSTSSVIISMTTTPSLPKYGFIVIVGLITFLILKEILSVTELWNQRINDCFNMQIIPLTLVFVGITVFKIITILHPLWFK